MSPADLTGAAGMSREWDGVLTGSPAFEIFVRESAVSRRRTNRAKVQSPKPPSTGMTAPVTACIRRRSMRFAPTIARASISRVDPVEREAFGRRTQDSRNQRVAAIVVVV
jgi:hypothetical protein